MRLRLVRTAMTAVSVIAMVGLASLVPAGRASASGTPARTAGWTARERANIVPGLHDVPGLPAVPGASRSAVKVQDLCPPARPGYASCAAETVIGPKQRAAAGAAPDTPPNQTPSGYGPGNLWAAYNLNPLGGYGETVAIVDAYDDPNAESDLDVYRSFYGLPACTTLNGCFTKVNQDGNASPLPSPDPNWAGEISLDLDMVSAICPYCHILLVESDDNSWANLGAAEDTAAGSGAKYVSNSYGAPEQPTDPSNNQYYEHPGIVITAASGDNGYGVEYPASYTDVTAVGGTSLLPAQNARGFDEIAWTYAGSGCSQYQYKPTWQTDPGCAGRTVADVSAVADPNTGVSMYDTYPTPLLANVGWNIIGGTSVATPIIASVYALAGTPAANTYPASYPYQNASALNDIVTGTNSPWFGCTPAYLCNAGPGYDGPTGLGTPNGTAAFTP